MSTRSTAHFLGGSEKPRAIIYRHSDGYPEGAGADILAFFEKVKADTHHDTRFMDPSYLAAKYVVFLAHIFATKHDFVDGKFVERDPEPWSLDFISVGVESDDPGDIEYRYLIDTHEMVDDRPKVIVVAVGFDGTDRVLGEIADVLKQQEVSA